ncbi:hypothetical protein [Alicyclobacillus suci]|uniref:hypothetical protein n=1 Tax=Alicyclobacillus suci TaxID=2816080 RepID=UPI001A9022BD|nr:hypothetical protein [Alicyclobacillus suci]
MPKRKHAQERLEASLVALKSFATELGYWPSKEQWDRYASEHGMLRYMSIYHHLRRSWNLLRDDMGFAPREIGPTEEECIAALREATKTSPLLPRRDYEAWRQAHPGYPSAIQIILRLGGTWNMAKEKAGLVTIDPSHDGYSDEELRSSLLECSKVCGEKFSENDYIEWRENNPGHPHIATIRARFGGTAEAKRALGLETYDIGSPTEYTEAQVLSSLIRFLRDQLNIDVYDEWRKQHDGPSITAIRARFAGYEEALHRALELYFN